MAELQLPVDLGFTEFVSALLSEVLESVVSNQVQQEQRRGELLEAASLDPEAFAALHVGDAEVEGYLAQLFPASAAQRPHDAASGTPYRPAEGDRDEQPPYAERLGVRLAGGDVSAETGRLLASGARRLAAAARRRLAEQQVAAARDLVEGGVPRVQVDGGRITARVTFEALQFREQAVEDVDDGGAAEDDTAEPDDGTQPRMGEEILGQLGGQPLRTSAGLSRRNPLVLAGRLPDLRRPTVVPEVLRDVRLKVHTADETDDEPATGRAHVYGEVELTFRTVT